MHIEKINETKCMFFLLKNDELLEIYNEIWDIQQQDEKKNRFNIKPVYTEKYIKFKIN